MNSGVSRSEIIAIALDDDINEKFRQDSFLFSKAARYDVKGKKYFDYPSKYYCTDVGLRKLDANSLKR